MVFIVVDSRVPLNIQIELKSKENLFFFYLIQNKMICYRQNTNILGEY